MQADVYELDKFDRDRENRITDEKQWALLNTKIYLLLAPNINIKAFEKKINSYIRGKTKSHNGDSLELYVI